MMNDAGKPRLIERIFPGLTLFRKYQRQWLLSDVLAGISVCVVMIPTVIAYAGLVGVPPQYGLYAALVPLLVYPLFGSSRQVIVGPDIAISLLIASAVGPLAGGDPNRTAALSAVIAVISGLLLMLGAKAKFGMVADFFSKPVLVGYMTGAALILMASQFSKFFGVQLHRVDFFPLLYELASRIRETSLPTLGLGLAFLVLLVVMRKLAPRLPGALVVCVIAVALSQVFHLRHHGVAVVGQFPAGLPRLAFPNVSWWEVHTLLPASIGIALLTYTECILLARAFAEKNRYEVDPNQELSALGYADIITGLFQGFSVTGSQARTTVNDATGGKTQASSLVAALTLALFLRYLTPVIAPLPVVALAAILIHAGFSLVEFDVIKRIYRYYPRSSMLAAVTTLGVLAGGVIPGILLGVAISLVGLINRISHPVDAVLQEVPGKGFHDIGETQATQTVPGLIAYRFYAPLLFSNCTHFVERARELVASSPARVQWFLLDAQAITDIDVTAAEAIMKLKQELRDQGIALKICRANRPLREILQRAGLTHDLGEENFFPSVHRGVEAFLAQPSKA
jgi:SulP family sulfate permease